MHDLFRITKSSPVFKLWKDIPIPVYMKFHLFNVTNPDDIGQGAKPILREMGPYTYLTKMQKYDITKNSTRDTVKYKQNRTFFFQPDLSVGREDDQVTIINVLFIAVSHMANDFTDLDFILETLDQMLVDRDERLTRTVKVKDILFDGISIQTYVDLVNDPMVQQAGEIEFPEDYKDGLFALLKGKNGTHDGFWEMYSGRKNSKQFAQIYSIQNGRRKLDLYKADSCNAINGSDGTFNPPFIEPGVTELYAFVPEICRSVKWQYLFNAVTYGINVARYTLPAIESVPENPDKWCFCPKEDPMECDISGMESLTACFQGAPVQLSKPHFLETDRELLKGVGGMRPDERKHQSKLDIHPLTGATVEAQVRLQFSIDLVPWPAMPSFQNATRAMIPFAWIELSATLDQLNLIGLWILSSFLEIWPVLRVLNILGALGTISIGSMIGFARKSKIDKDSDAPPKEQEKPPGKRLLTKSEEEESSEPVLEEIQDDSSVTFITKAKEE
ncbi:Scavenger receptor class B member 1 [Orchesella cincta]|uniref:Scavenger receptor class B member 1 n=1 Tax=Orchesella cincta TaxID=48709 RepID=A0A1D2MA92_ORCCI|nr:Scavenger receptor class B member 1 [Orchesella cincta]